MEEVEGFPITGATGNEGFNPSRRAVLRTVTAAAVATTIMPGVQAADAAPADGFGAPLVELHVPVGILSAEQKSAMIKGVSDVLVKAMDLQPEQMRFLWVQIIEVSSGGWGVGGQVFIPKSQLSADGQHKG
ncbi:hypothetical protein GCM10011611_24610 [Aliidongia dinghuensis]|uniref:4-oxalocrotonate tautomerase-like domain-containing protein n=1 Tax=Aliidongia dinghuensis TaxID=1867774 RepID=A0A8J3E4X4_9PROT|nr:tautomerase family protein [Aliidongia dinghuensis]GGF17833.1 hypothetical protein GCM10011611_24610 [Aliidongia dinghuensis]